MINFIQSNQNIKEFELNVISDPVWQDLYNQFAITPAPHTEVDNIVKYLNNISIKYNIDKKNIIKDFLNYIIRNKPTIISQDFLNFVENIMHIQDCKTNNYIHYSLLRLMSFIPKVALA